MTGRARLSGGGLHDEPAWLLDAVAVVEAETTLIEVARAERARKR